MLDARGDDDVQALLAGLRSQLSGDLKAFLSEHHLQLQRQFNDWMASESAAFEQAAWGQDRPSASSQAGARTAEPPHAAQAAPKALQPRCWLGGPPSSSLQASARALEPLPESAAAGARTLEPRSPSRDSSLQAGVKALEPRSLSQAIAKTLEPRSPSKDGVLQASARALEPRSPSQETAPGACELPAPSPEPGSTAQGSGGAPEHLCASSLQASARVREPSADRPQMSAAVPVAAQQRRMNSAGTVGDTSFGAGSRRGTPPRPIEPERRKIFGSGGTIWGSRRRTSPFGGDAVRSADARDAANSPARAMNSTYSHFMNTNRMQALKGGNINKSKYRRHGLTIADGETLYCNPRAWARDLLHSPYCNYFFSSVIVTYIITMGIEVEEISDDLRVSIVHVQSVCDVLFICEVVLRMFAMGREFFGGQEWQWNLWDLVLAIVSIVERVFMETTQGTNSSLDSLLMLRVVRITRVIRIMRVTRLFRFFRSLRQLITSICATMKSLIYAVLLLGMIMYSFGVVFTQCARDYESEVMYKHFGSMVRSISTLFQSVTSGLSWEVCFEVLSDAHWLYGLLFGVYILFALFCVMNVITAQFCQNAIESSKHDEEEAISDQMADRSIYVDKLEKLFTSITDETGHCVITLETFEKNMGNERVVAFLRSLDIKASDAWTLFRLLDEDNNSAIDMDKFIQGCLQLKGPATAIHVQELSSQLHWFTNHVDRKFTTLTGRQAAIEKHLAQLTGKHDGGKFGSEGEGA